MTAFFDKTVAPLVNRWDNKFRELWYEKTPAAQAEKVIDAKEGAAKAFAEASEEQEYKERIGMFAALAGGVIVLAGFAVSSAAVLLAGAVTVLGGVVREVKAQADADSLEQAGRVMDDKYRQYAVAMIEAEVPVSSRTPRLNSFLSAFFNTKATEQADWSYTQLRRDAEESRDRVMRARFV